MMVMEEEHWDEHYSFIAFVGLGHIVQPNIGYIHQGPETKVFEKAIVLVEFALAPSGPAFPSSFEAELVFAAPFVSDAPAAEAKPEKFVDFVAVAYMQPPGPLIATPKIIV